MFPKPGRGRTSSVACYSLFFSDFPAILSQHVIWLDSEMRDAAAVLIVSAISVTSMAAIVVILLDTLDRSSAVGHLAAGYLGSPGSAAVFAILFIGGAVLSVWAQSRWAAVALLPTLGLSFAPIIVGFHGGLLVPRGAIVAFAREFGDSSEARPCPPGWSAVQELAGKMPLGAGNGLFSDGTALTPRELNDEGGEENHTLSVPELPPHAHATLNFDHSTNNQAIEPGGNNAPFVIGETPTGSTGEGQAHNNMPPYRVVQFCSFD